MLAMLTEQVPKQKKWLEMSANHFVLCASAA